MVEPVTDHDPITWAGRILRVHGMPMDEIRAIVEAHDPALVHRHMKLHGERLQEQLTEQLRALESLEALLAKMMLERRDVENRGRRSSRG